MKQRFYLAISLLSLSAAVNGQSKPPHSNQTTPAVSAPTQPRPKASQSKSVSKAPQPKPKYLTESLDLRQTNLGTNFLGNDIVAVVNAIKNSPVLKEKSEFESTSAFQTRRAGFIDQPLYANLVPTGHFAFIVEDSVYSPAFKYDADAQMMGVTVSGRTIQFLLDNDNATLDTILIRRIGEDRDSYIGSNSFGASVKVDRTYSNEFGVAFDHLNCGHDGHYGNHGITPRVHKGG